MEVDEAATFAGLFIQHEPEYRVVARFTRSGENTLERYVRGGSLEGLVEAEPASATLAELRLAESDAARVARSAGIPADSAVHVGGNRVELMVTDRGSLQRALEAPRAALSEEVVVEEVEELAQPARSSVAGLRLFRFDFPNFHWCTSGFTVRRDADTEGVLTAAHCTGEFVRDNSQATFRMHYKSDGRLIFLPREGRRLYGSWDLEWHTTPGYDDQAVFFDGASYRNVTGLIRRTETGEGDLVCDYGRTTGYSCSQVGNVNFRPRYVPEASATFIRTARPKSYGPLSDEGDSGGPVFNGSDAAGIISGSNNSKPDYNT